MPPERATDTPGTVARRSSNPVGEVCSICARSTTEMLCVAGRISCFGSASLPPSGFSESRPAPAAALGVDCDCDCGAVACAGAAGAARELVRGFARRGLGVAESMWTGGNIVLGCAACACASGAGDINVSAAAETAIDPHEDASNARHDTNTVLRDTL